MLEEKQKFFSEAQAKQKENTILSNLPDGIIYADFIKNGSCVRFSNGVEHWCYKGKPFLEIHPPEFETIEYINCIRMVAKQRYRAL